MSHPGGRGLPPATSSEASRARWNRRWAEERAGERPAPSEFLVVELEGASPGAALDLACGAGRNAVWLARRGWRVTAVDFSPAALAMARALAAEMAVRVDWIEADVVAWTPSPGAYDLVCVLYLQLPPLERRIVLARAAAAVRPGGTLLVLGHDRLNLTEGWAGPTQAEVLFTPDDVVAEIGDLEVVKAERVRRAMADAPPGRAAIDALVRARRPASG